METRASHVLIGSFALAIVVLTVLSILWLGRLSLDREWDLYDVVFTEAVSGLGKGGAVEYNGIQVGEVRGLSLDVRDPRKVIARVRMNADTPVKTDTRAKLSYTGLTGVSVIQLSGGTPAAPRLLPDAGAEAAVIIADASALQSLLASGEGIAVSADRLLIQLARLLRDDNIEALSRTFANLDVITAGISARGADIDAALTDLAAFGQALRSMQARADALLISLDETARGAQTVVTGDLPGLVAETHATLLAVRRASEVLTAVVADNSAALDSFSQQGLAEVGPAVGELRATLRPLRALAERLEAEPGLLLQGAAQPREHAAP